MPGDRDRIRQAICAYANDLPNYGLPGVIFVGQNDDGTCANTDITDALLLTLSQMKDDGRILPVPSMHVERRTIENCTLAVVTVDPSTAPPVRLDGRTWIRVGPRRATATLEEERRLTERQLWRNLSFDARPFPGATLDQLDLTRFEKEYLPAAVSAEIRRRDERSAAEQLQALRLASPEEVPNAAAILMLGKDPRALLPGAYIQFLRINGTSLTDPIVSQKEISGSIPDQIRQVEELIKINIATAVDIGGPKRLETPDYPLEAIEQIIRNALMHRNYENSTTPVKLYWFSDRIEIHSPGGLFGEVTPETIWRNATSYRNPVLAEGMKILGLVERFGFGLTKAKDSLAENKNPPLESDFVDTFVLFAIRRRP
jgi:ATP-dependent DNA helicase RecG